MQRSPFLAPHRPFKMSRSNRQQVATRTGVATCWLVPCAAHGVSNHGRLVNTPILYFGRYTKQAHPIESHVTCLIRTFRRLVYSFRD